MTEIDYVNLLTNVGFPIFVALYFMFRLEKIIKTNTTAINKIIDIANFNRKTILALHSKEEVK